MVRAIPPKSRFAFELAEQTLGYIRSRALPECDLQEVRSLKAFIAYDAIAHPDHPLSAGKGGAELFLGTISSSTSLSHTPRC